MRLLHLLDTKNAGIKRSRYAPTSKISSSAGRHSSCSIIVALAFAPMLACKVLGHGAIYLMAQSDCLC